MKSALFNFLFGPDPRVRRLLRYWGGTALLYVLWIAVLQVQVLAGKASAVDAGLLTIFGVTGMLCFFV
ncbi:MAG: GGDEF domain-containing protein, partial [Massilia sp.]